MVIQVIMVDSINPRPPQFSQPDIGQLNRFVSLIQLEDCSAVGGPGLGLGLDLDFGWASSLGVRIGGAQARVSVGSVGWVDSGGRSILLVVRGRVFVLVYRCGCGPGVLPKLEIQDLAACWLFLGLRRSTWFWLGAMSRDPVFCPLGRGSGPGRGVCPEKGGAVPCRSNVVEGEHWCPGYVANPGCREEVCLW